MRHFGKCGMNKIMDEHAQFGAAPLKQEGFIYKYDGREGVFGYMSEDDIRMDGSITNSRRKKWKNALMVPRSHRQKRYTAASTGVKVNHSVRP
jgi:hypothetical protein